MRYAGFWKRANAYGYDVIIVHLLALTPMVLFYPFPTLEQVVRLDPRVETWISTFGNLYLVFSAFYNIGLVAGPQQATLGKRYCGVKVVMADGAKPTILQATTRHATSGLSMVLGGLGFLPVLFTRQKTALHDMLASTRVIRRD